MKRFGAVVFEASSPPAFALQIAGAFSPWVELEAEDLVLIDLSGLERQWRNELLLARAIRQKFQACRLPARVAIASNRSTARLAARGCEKEAIIPDGEEMQALAPLPLALLNPPEELRQTFERWGLHTLGDLARLPENSLAQRLDSQGMELYRQACGQDSAPLTPYLLAEPFEAFYAWDWPVENSGALAFTLNQLLEPLCLRLDQASLAAESVELQLDLADRTSNKRLLRFGAPFRDPATILSLLRLDLEARPPESAVASLGVRLHPTLPRPTQFSLLDPPLPAPEKLARTLARLSALVGEENVGSPVLLNTHQPDAFEMKAFQIADDRLKSKFAAQGLPPARDSPLSSRLFLTLRRFRPPLPAEVFTGQKRPTAVAASGIRGRVVECGGPWRSSGGWWENRWGWNRDQWDVLLSDGGLYRLYQDLRQEHWFVDGVYD